MTNCPTKTMKVAEDSKKLMYLALGNRSFVRVETGSIFFTGP